MDRIFKTIVLTMAGMIISAIMAFGDNLEDQVDFKSRIKNCNTSQCLAALKAEADQNMADVSSNCNEDFMGIGNDVLGKQSKSVIEEIIYHLDTLEAHHNFRDVFYFEKLKKIKAARKKFDRHEITEKNFNRTVKQADINFKNDLLASEDLINEKAFRLMELCKIVETNVTTIKSTQMYGGSLSAPVRESIVSLYDNDTWQAFISKTPRGLRIRKALGYASESAANGLISSLTRIFIGFRQVDSGVVLSAELIDRLVEKNPIH